MVLERDGIEVREQPVGGDFQTEAVYSDIEVQCLIISGGLEDCFDDPGGIIVTMLIGIAGAFVGGFVSTQLGLGTVSGFDIRSLAIAIGGALLLLFGYRQVKRRSS